VTPLITERAAPAPAPAPATATEADRLAARNWRSNAEALGRRRDPLLASLTPAAAGDDLTWAFARDGYLTCFEPGERWFAGCSVPLLAARAMLKPLDGSAGVACFLSPAHAAQVRVVLERLQPSHALLCVAPDVRVLEVMLRCDDFAADIDRGRLWFAAGREWPGALARILSDTPGLPTPTRFVRMPDADAATIEVAIAEAQRVIGEQNARRAAAVASLRDNWTPTASPAASPRVAVVARSKFRLWDDAGHALWTALADPEDHPAASTTLARFDPDDPAGSSPLALSTAAAGADVLVSADLSRSDAPRVAPAGLPWVTWVTTPRVPPFAAAGPNDRLLLADPAWRDDAVRAGWPAERVGVAGWPNPRRSADPGPDAERAPSEASRLAIIADTTPLDVPDALAEFSSHGLLWERIRRDVLRDPFAVPGDVIAFVRAHARAAGIAAETLDLALFADRLVVVAFQQGVADALLAAGLPLRLHGGGWADLPRFAPHAAGPVDSRESLREAALTARALVHVWPTSGAHPIDALGRPVVRRTGPRREAFLRDARGALPAAPVVVPSEDVARLNLTVLLNAIRS
jgi:hypothetical protein